MWQLRKYLGHIVNFLLLARPTLCVLDALYGSMVGMAEDDWIFLSDAMRNELKVVRALLPLVVADLRLELNPTCYMTDSSSKGFAVFFTNCATEELEKLVRWKERSRFKRVEVCSGAPDPYFGCVADALFSPELDLEEACRTNPKVKRPFELQDQGGLHPLSAQLLNPQRWSLLVAGAWRHADKIHNLEARAALMGLRRASQAHLEHGLELVSFGDNLSAICAFEKGRAHYGGLQVHCRRAASLQLGCGILWRHRHVISELNIADFMSRSADRFELRPGQVRRVLSQREHKRMLAKLQIEHERLACTLWHNAPDATWLSPQVSCPRFLDRSSHPHGTAAVEASLREAASRQHVDA
eukprot:3267142-Amphidinium_carterae.1